MRYQGEGRVLKSVGGRFKVRLFEGSDPMHGLTVFSAGRKNLHRVGDLLAGDLVRISYDDSSFQKEGGAILPNPDGNGTVIEEILPRKSALIRPPLANLDFLFVSVAVANPAPIPETADKLISIAEFHEISPVILLTKCELDREMTEKIRRIYETAGFPVFALGEGGEWEKLQTYLAEYLPGKVAAVAGASGVGKSSLLNKLFPNLSLEIGELSQKIARGKNTTRQVELYPLSDAPDCGYLADTPGFTMLDFEHFDFFDKEDLPYTFREFLPYIGSCKYTKCSHTKEEGCAILEAVKEGKIPQSRHQSFVALFDVLKKKKDWE